MAGPLAQNYQSTLVSPYVIEGTDRSLGKFVLDMRAGTVTTECSVFRGAYVHQYGSSELHPADPSIDLTTVPWDLTTQPQIYCRNDYIPVPYFSMPTQNLNGSRFHISFLLEEHMTKDTYNFENEQGTLTIKIINRLTAEPPAIGAVVKLKPSGVTHIFHDFCEYVPGQPLGPKVPLERVLRLTWEKMGWSLNPSIRNERVMFRRFYTDRSTGERESVALLRPNDLNLHIFFFGGQAINLLSGSAVPRRMIRIIRRLAWKRWELRILAFLSGGHPRLGVASPLRQLDDAMLQTIIAALCSS